MAARKAAVLGSPIAHSLSPVLHTAAYRELGLTDWCYQAIECDADGLPGLLDSLGPEWAGLSLTMPLKRAVLPLLDRADALVTEVGGANTVVLAEGGRLGFNTDVAGMVAAISEAGAKADGSVLVLGAGATACSALAALRITGASDIAVAVRDETRAGPLREVARRLGLGVQVQRLELAGPGGPVPSAPPKPGVRPKPGPLPDLRLSDRQPIAGHWQLLISTLPGSAADPIAGLVFAGAIAADAVFDVVYQPWPTKLAEAAASTGSTVISGFELLVHQAALQVQLMTSLPAPTSAMRAAGLAELAQRRQRH
jgi:shikimate dehydrogenase